MRKFTRASVPSALELHGARWNQQWTELRSRNPQAKFSWYSVGGQTVRELILPALRDQTLGHCSFCDGFPLDVTTTEPIEHLRPKAEARFHHLAFDWSNLYYCCNRCQAEKGVKWDEGLLAADELEYQFERYFQFEVTTGALAPNPLAKAEDHARAVVTIRIFNLNAPERVRERLVTLRNWHRSSVRELAETPYRDFIEAGSLTTLNTGTPGDST